MNNNNKKGQKFTRQPNPLEALKDIGTSTADQMKREASKLPGDFMEQLLGIRPQPKNFSGEIIPGESLEFTEVFSGRYEEIVKTKNQIALEQKTESLAEETKIAALQGPVEPGIYHIIFFEKLLDFLKSFSKKIEEASVWLHAVNKRAAKKNVWGAHYKSHGAKYLLSSEHYLQRSAG